MSRRRAPWRVARGYARNPHEVEARRAVSETR
jgi:hypothetical protein